MSTIPFHPPDPTLETSLRGHRNVINSVAFSPSGSQLASGGDDLSVMMWTLAGSPSSIASPASICYRFIGHEAPVLSVAFAPTFLLSSSRDGCCRLWRLNRVTGRQPERESLCYRCHQSPVRTVDVVPHDFSQFATGSDDKIIKLWSTSVGNKFLQSLVGGHTNWIRAIKYQPSTTSTIASCGDDANICVWDTRDKISTTSGPQVKLSTPRRTAHYLSISWHPNCDHLLATSSVDGSIRIWDLRQQRLIQFYSAHNGSVNCIDFHASGNYLISGSSDSTSKIFDLLEGRVLFTLKAHAGAINTAIFSPSGEYFATAGADKQIRIWKSNLLDQMAAEFNVNAPDAQEIIGHGAVGGPNTRAKTSATSRFQAFPDLAASGVASEVSHGMATDSLPRTITSRSTRPKSPDPVEIYESDATTSVDISGGDYHHQQQQHNGSGTFNLGSNANGNHFDFQEGILAQLSILTETVSLIEQRLSLLEEKVEKHCSPQAGIAEEGGRATRSMYHRHY